MPMPIVPANPIAQILGHADLGGGGALGSRRGAERRARRRVIETAVVGHGWIAFDPAAAQRELGSLKLGQRGRVAEYGRGHILRPGDAHARHAARGRPHDILQVGAVALPASQTGIRGNGNRDGQTNNMYGESHVILPPMQRFAGNGRVGFSPPL